MSKPKEVVEQAAVVLDGIMPGWDEFVDTRTMTLANGTDCILGQIGPEMARRQGHRTMLANNHGGKMISAGGEHMTGFQYMSSVYRWRFGGWWKLRVFISSRYEQPWTDLVNTRMKARRQAEIERKRRNEEARMAEIAARLTAEHERKLAMCSRRSILRKRTLENA